MSEPKTADVIVIGGGLAGLIAMRNLRADGKTVILLEARDRLGGRTWYRKFKGTEQFVEIGGTWTVDRMQPRVTAEKQRYSLGTLNSPDPQHWRMSFEGKVRNSWMPVEYPNIAGFEQGVYHLIHDSKRIEFGKPIDQQGVDDLDVSFETWMAQKDIASPTRAFFSAFVAESFGCAPSEVGAVHFLTWIAGMGNSPWTMSTVLTEKFAKGTKSLVDALVDEANADIRLSNPVARVEQDSTGVTVTTRTGDLYRARTAIVATPLNTWNDIEFSPTLSEPKATAAAQGHSGRAVKPWALVKGAPDYFASWAWDGGMCFLSTEFQIEEGSVMMGFAHTPDILDIKDAEDVAAKVEAVLPKGAKVISVDGHDWIGDEFSKGTWMAFRPGQLTRLHSGLMANEGRLVFAGSDIALRWAGWIEGALESGHDAAQKASAIV